MDVDGVVKLEDLTWEAMHSMDALRPFGKGNPMPVFYAHNLLVIESRVVGKNHLKLKMKQGRIVMDGIGFGLGSDRPLSDEINAVFTPEINQWRGIERIQLRIADCEAAGGETRLRMGPWSDQVPEAISESP
jgi:single-stranded-DNA-specific exonuclease